jgi:hypothetical protein
MSSVINKRIEKLEANATGGGKQISVIVIRGLTADNGKPAHPQPNVIAAKYMRTGETFAHRHNDETGEDFEKRACGLAKKQNGEVSIITLITENMQKIMESNTPNIDALHYLSGI